MESDWVVADEHYDYYWYVTMLVCIHTISIIIPKTKRPVRPVWQDQSSCHFICFDSNGCRSKIVFAFANLKSGLRILTTQLYNVIPIKYGLPYNLGDNPTIIPFIPCAIKMISFNWLRTLFYVKPWLAGTLKQSWSTGRGMVQGSMFAGALN